MLGRRQARQVHVLRDGGESIAELVRGFGVSRATIYRVLAHDPSQQPSH